MKVVEVPVIAREEIAEGIFCLSFASEEIGKNIKPGQFVNIRIGEGLQPLLRRPFSISRSDGPVLEIIFNVVGAGTRILAGKKKDDILDILGPLGIPFGVDGEYETALIVAGGLGVAPFPFLTELLRAHSRRIETFLGARNAGQIAERFLENVHVATDDGSRGFHGTVVDLLDHYLREHPPERPKIFACGPTPMLRALTEYAIRTNIECELSLEGEMACGIGICQGCPVERVRGPKRYALVCTEGPTFNCRDVQLN